MTAAQTLRPAWTPLTIGLMVLGFIIWWPLGLAMIAYILWGDRLHDAIRDNKYEFKAYSANAQTWPGNNHRRASGNSAFDDYRAQELDRLRAERRRLDDGVKEFEDYLSNLRMARDRDEFNRYMKERDDRRKKSNDKNNDNDVIET